jgi:small subunit ribosomal protein S17
MSKLIKSFNGTVVSAGKIDKTVTVNVNRIVTHSKYGKSIKKTSRFLVHDESNRCKTGDNVTIISCRPLSKLKSFKIDKVLSDKEA